MEEGLQDQKIMICLICRKAQLEDGFTTVIFDRDELKLVVNVVPALVCHSCGDAYFNCLDRFAVVTICGTKCQIRHTPGNLRL